MRGVPLYVLSGNESLLYFKGIPNSIPPHLSPPERAVIVTEDEQSALIEISHRIEEFITRKITNFRTCFPFGCPKDDLKVTIKLFNLVGMSVLKRR